MIPELVPEDWVIFAPGSPCPLEVARLVEAQHLWRRATAPISCDVMQTLRVLVRLLRLGEDLEAMRKIAAPTPSPSSPALAMGARPCRCAGGPAQVRRTPKVGRRAGGESAPARKRRSCASSIPGC